MLKQLPLIIIFLAFGKIYCQENSNVKLKNIKQILPHSTTNYGFENGKLKSIDIGYSTTFFEYNNKGTLSSWYYINVNDKSKYSESFSYDEKGYITSIISKVDNKILREAKFEYQKNNDNDFFITKITKHTGYNGDYFTKEIFEMKNNILKITEEKSKIRSRDRIDEFTFENGNIVSYHFNIKNKKEQYLVKFTYDNTTNINYSVMKGFYGDKHFVNSILDKPMKIVTLHLIPSKNNVVSKRIVKKAKRIGVSEYDYSIEYDSSNRITKITETELERGRKNTFILEY